MLASSYTHVSHIVWLTWSATMLAIMLATMSSTPKPPPKNIFKFGPPQGRSHQRMKRCEAARATVKQTLQLARNAGKANYRTRGGATAGTISVANHQLETNAGGQNTPGTQANMQA